MAISAVLLAVLFTRASATSPFDPAYAGCTDEERLQVNSFAPGYIAGGFGRITDDCTKAAVNVIMGIEQRPFLSCMSKTLKVSRNCSYCWYGSGQYGFNNCKLACLGSWCAKKCLRCSHPAVKNIIACAGITGPEPTPCDGVPGDETGAENPMKFLGHKLWQSLGGHRLYADVHKPVDHSSGALSPQSFAGFVFFGFLALGVAGLISLRRQAYVQTTFPEEAMFELTTEHTDCDTVAE